MTWAARFTFNKSNGAHVLRVAGRVGGANAADFQKALDDAADGAARRLIVDFSATDYLSSRALAALDAAAARCRQAGGGLILAGVTEPVRITLELAGLVPRIPVEPSVEAASRALA